MTVHIHITDSITDEAFVEKKFVPALEKVIGSGRSNIVIDTDNLTGSAPVALG